MNKGNRQRVLVVDFGAQYGQLIARRVRDLHVFCEVVPSEIPVRQFSEDPPAAIILSGGPASVYAEHAPELNPQLLQLGVPVLGFCYGMQAMAQVSGGRVAQTDVAEYGPAELQVLDEGSLLFRDTPPAQTVWMSHRDSVSVVPDGFVATASTPATAIAAMENAEKQLYATQFHPEVHHTVFGSAILKNFLFGIAGLVPDWTTEGIARTAIEAVRTQVGSNKVILGLSGGVDSSVAAALLSRAIGTQLTCVFVDHGLLRKNEPEEVRRLFTTDFGGQFVYVDATERYLTALAGIVDPEEKRAVIGSLFWEIFFEEAERIAERTGEPVRYLAQGTIYPDIIESGATRKDGAIGGSDAAEESGVIGGSVAAGESGGANEGEAVSGSGAAQGGGAARENEATPKRAPAYGEGGAACNSAAAREDGAAREGEDGAARNGIIAVPAEPATTGSEKAATIKSHHNLIPFPKGVHFELIEPLRDLFKDEVRALGLSLGLPDSLVYRQPFPGPGLAVRIIGEVTREKLATLKDADAIVREEIDDYNRQLHEKTGLRESERSVWQYFAVLPDIRSVGVMGDERTYERPIVLRAVESKDAMTADWARLPHDLLASISSRIVAEVDGINRVVYDITSKPPGTIEWE